MCTFLPPCAKHSTKPERVTAYSSPSVLSRQKWLIGSSFAAAGPRSTSTVDTDCKVRFFMVAYVRGDVWWAGKLLLLGCQRLSRTCTDAPKVMPSTKTVLSTSAC
jgi:hypothetical protein